MRFTKALANPGKVDPVSITHREVAESTFRRRRGDLDVTREVVRDEFSKIHGDQRNELSKISEKTARRAQSNS